MPARAAGTAPLPPLLLLLLCTPHASSEAVKAYLGGYVSGEVYTKAKYGHGTVSATFNISGFCPGVDTGVGLVAKTSTEQHDITLFFSQQSSAVFTATVSVHDIVTGAVTSSWRTQGWAPGEPTSSITLAIQWLQTSTVFLVDGVAVDELFPIATPTVTSSTTARYVPASSDALYSSLHQVALFSGPSAVAAPSAACLPQKALFGKVSFTPVTGTPLAQTEWSDAVMVGWDKATPVGRRVSSERSVYGTVVAGAAALEGASLALWVANPLLAPLSAARDVDPDLTSGAFSEAVWNITSDVQSTVRAERTTQADGKIALRVISTGANEANESSIAIEKTVYAVERDVAYCSLARVFSERLRNVSLSTLDNLDLHQSDHLLIPSGSWQLFNSCYVQDADFEMMHLRALLGRYNTEIEFHAHNVFLDFLYTLELKVDTAPLVWEGTELLESWYRNPRAPTKLPQFPWDATSTASSWTIVVENEVVSNNVVTYSGRVSATCTGNGVGRLRRLTLDIAKGATYRVSVTARVTSATSAKKLAYVSMHTTAGAILGGVNQFELTSTNRTYEYTFHADVTDIATALTITLHSGQTPSYGGFSSGDVVEISTVTLERWSKSEAPAARFPAISPDITSRSDNTTQTLDWSGINVYKRGTSTGGGVVQTPIPTAVVPLQDLYATRYDKMVISLQIVGGVGVPEMVNVTQLRTDLSGFVRTTLDLATVNENNIKVLKVCLNSERLEITNSSAYEILDIPVNAVENCRGVVAAPSSWYEHLHLNGTIEVHFVLVNFPVSRSNTEDTRTVARVLDNLLAVAKTNGDVSISIGSTVIGSDSTATPYIPTYNDLTPAPLVPPVEGSRRADLKDGLWVVILVSAFVFCILVGVGIAHALVSTRPDLVESDSDISSEEDMERKDAHDEWQ